MSLTGVRRKRGGRRPNTKRYYVIVGCVAILAVIFSAVVLLSGRANPAATTSKPVILYVNQGNGMVNESSYPTMLSFATSKGFNTVFFQVFRQGSLLYSVSELQYFVQSAHSRGIRVFFALYFTEPSQAIPASVYPLGEDGISLDMSTLTQAAQLQLFSAVQAGYRSGLIAITTTDMSSTLKPDMLVLETYGVQNEAYIRHGIIASVGVFATSGRSDYEQQLQFALNNSDGVMVFDYAGLVRAGY